MSKKQIQAGKSFSKKLIHPVSADMIIFEVFWSDVKHKVYQRQLESWQNFRRAEFAKKSMLVLNFSLWKSKYTY